MNYEFVYHALRIHILLSYAMVWGWKPVAGDLEISFSELYLKLYAFKIIKPGGYLFFIRIGVLGFLFWVKNWVEFFFRSADPTINIFMFIEFKIIVSDFIMQLYISMIHELNGSIDSISYNSFDVGLLFFRFAKQVKLFLWFNFLA